MRGETLLGILALRDTLRDDARQAVDALHQLGVQGVILTGDNPRAAAAIASELGLEFRAGLLPADKVNAVIALNADAPLAMIGDGINDAPAMKAATIGIAMGSGTDVALETADAALTHNRLTGLAQMISLARATHANIRQNIAIALGLKGIFLVTTLLGLTGLWLAVLADTGATVLVTANALRLLRKSCSIDTGFPARATLSRATVPDRRVARIRRYAPPSGRGSVAFADQVAVRQGFGFLGHQLMLHKAAESRDIAGGGRIVSNNQQRLAHRHRPHGFTHHHDRLRAAESQGIQGVVRSGEKFAHFSLTSTKRPLVYPLLASTQARLTFARKTTIALRRQRSIMQPFLIGFPHPNVPLPIAHSPEA